MKKISIIGAGLMGHALALVYALGGFKVRLTDSNTDTLERSKILMGSALDLLIKTKEISSNWSRQKLSKSVTWCTNLGEAVEGAELVVEAIIESSKEKRNLFKKLSYMLSNDSILASNTSSLNVFPLIPSSLQKNSLIMHWYSPPYLCDLVDLAPGPKTDPQIVRKMFKIVKSLNKEPVIFKKFIPGYIANRIQRAIHLEIFDLIDKKLVSPEDIDRSVIHGLALRMPIIGVMAKMDFEGLPLVQTLLANKGYKPPVDRGKCINVDSLIDAGKKGVMNGKGFFDWNNRSPEDLFKERNIKLIKLKKALRKIKPMGIKTHK